MEANISSVRLKYRYAANYGLILGGYIAVFYFLQILFSNSTVINLVSSVAQLATPVVCYFITKSYRDKALGGFIKFGQAWSFGIWLFLFAGLIMSVVYFIHFQIINQDFIADMYNESMLLFEKINYPKESLDLIAKNGPPTTYEMIISYLFGYIILGAILYIFISPLVVRKNNDENIGSDKYEPYKDINKDIETKE